MRAKILLVDDDPMWLHSIQEQFPVGVHTTSFDNFDAAADFIGSDQIHGMNAAIFDVRLREALYDQGGLGLLALLKEQCPSIPVVVLTNFADDYPGIREVTERYTKVLTYNKSVFMEKTKPILGALLTELPPQIGDEFGATKDAEKQSLTVRERTGKAKPVILREISIGIAVIAFVLGVAWLFFILAERFANFGTKLDIVFAISVIAVLCVLLRIFQPEVVGQAVNVFKDLTQLVSGRTPKRPAERSSRARKRPGATSR